MDYTYELETGKSEDIDSDLLVMGVLREDEDPLLEELPGLPEEPLNDFEGKKKETQLFYQGAFSAEKFLLLGLGTRDDLEISELPDVFGILPDYANEEDINDMTVVFPETLDIDRVQASKGISLGLTLGGYDFEEFKNDDDEDQEDDESSDLESITLLLQDRRSTSTIQEGYERGASLGKAIRFSRDLGNTPANHLVPEDLSQKATNLADKHDRLSVDVWDEEDLKEDDMNLIMAVGKGSENPPRLAHLKYEPTDSKASVAFAGKGVTFDTGGISIKPSQKMGEMKFDMCGAATVLGTVKHSAQIGLPITVHGFVPSAENMPGHRSVKPGDVVDGYAGKSVEILNTDAEGRLLLADTLGYISEELGEEIDCLVDFATLTGACITSLGHHAAGLMGNDTDLCETLETTGRQVDEPVWHLPLWEDYSKELESQVADVKNIGGDAGAITAGAFLREFVDEDVIEHWAHLDIAGTGWSMPELSYRPSGGTGFGVHLMDQFLRNEYSF